MKHSLTVPSFVFFAKCIPLMTVNRNAKKKTLVLNIVFINLSNTICPKEENISLLVLKKMYHSCLLLYLKNKSLNIIVSCLNSLIPFT